MIKGIIFDCDGVLTDSEVFYLSQAQQFIRDKGADTTIEDIMYFVGRSSLDIGNALKKQFGFKESAEQLAAEKREYHRVHMNFDEFKPMEGALEFINKCKNKGIKMSVASSSSNEYLKNVLSRFGIYDDFAFVLSGNDFEHSKPDPEIYNIAAEKMGIAKVELLVIEDSVNGIKAAKAAGIYTIGLKKSVVKQDTSEADCEVFSFDEINV